MDPQHLARLDDDGSVRQIRTGTAGGSSASASPEGHEVPASAPVHSTGTLVLAADTGSDAWPLLDVDALQQAGAADLGSTSAGELRAEAVAGAAGPRHRAPSTRLRRPALYLAAALIGVTGVAVTAASHSSQSAQADEPVSVADELGLVQADQQVLSEDEATSRLQELVASRAQREDAQAAAAQAQAQADADAAAAQAAAAAAAAEAARPKAVLPVQGAQLTSGFGSRWGTLHAGIDFAGPIGTPEYAAMDGVVVRAGAASGFGLAVYIQHGNGDVTVYGHMEQILVAEGQTVKAGDTIALLGNRGQSTGPHLHFEVHTGGIDGERVDPLPWLRDNGVQV
jgi:murein DD-endopeptidase MepM/ murein hydrolase activator NlpD